MTKEEIEEGKILISEFMNDIYDDRDYEYGLGWEWLMNVWHKFRDLKIDENNPNCTILSNHKIKIGNTISWKTINESFESIYIAIKWYNTQTTHK